MAQARAQVVDQHDQGDEDNDDGRRFLILKGTKARVHQVTDAAGTNQAQHRRGANVGFEAIEREGNQIRLNLRQHGEREHLGIAGAGRAYRIDHALIDVFNRLG